MTDIITTYALIPVSMCLHKRRYTFYKTSLFLFPGCCYATEYPELQEYTVDIGGNLTLPCTDSSTMLPLADPYSVIWVREGRDSGFNRRRIEPDGGLTLMALERDDSGIYTCTVEGDRGSPDDDTEVIRSRVKVDVRSECVFQFASSA
jgi:hypothetical protein